MKTKTMEQLKLDKEYYSLQLRFALKEVGRYANELKKIQKQIERKNRVK